MPPFMADVLFFFAAGLGAAGGWLFLAFVSVYTGVDMVGRVTLRGHQLAELGALSGTVGAVLAAALFLTVGS